MWPLSFGNYCYVFNVDFQFINTASRMAYDFYPTM